MFWFREVFIGSFFIFMISSSACLCSWLNDHSAHEALIIDSLSDQSEEKQQILKIKKLKGATVAVISPANTPADQNMSSIHWSFQRSFCPFIWLRGGETRETPDKITAAQTTSSRMFKQLNQHVFRGAET